MRSQERGVESGEADSGDFTSLLRFTTEAGIRDDRIVRGIYYAKPLNYRISDYYWGKCGVSPKLRRRKPPACGISRAPT